MLVVALDDPCHDFDVQCACIPTHSFSLPFGSCQSGSFLIQVAINANEFAIAQNIKFCEYKSRLNTLNI